VAWKLRLAKIQSQWGWKRTSDSVFCKDCWQKRYRLAAIILPIRPQDPKRWPELRPILGQLWRQSTCLANWAIHQLALHDSVPVPSHQKLVKPRPIALYRLAVDSYPDWSHWAGQTQAANALLRMAEKRWRRDRYQVLWRHRQAQRARLPSRSPFGQGVVHAGAREIRQDDRLPPQSGRPTGPYQ
jgi:hypothetical protein